MNIDDNALPFEGVYVNYKKSGLESSMFQTLAPGETVTASINAAKTYKLAGLASAKVQAIQGFRYVTGTEAPTSLKELETCEDVSSDTVAIVPDQSKVAA
jgi:deuterolysin